MLLQNGDESHGIPIPKKKHQLNHSQLIYFTPKNSHYFVYLPFFPLFSEVKKQPWDPVISLVTMATGRPHIMW